MSAWLESRASWRLSGRTERESPHRRRKVSTRQPTSRRDQPRAEMSVSAGSVWLDARGATSEAHGERGVRRYVSEHTRALLEFAPELIGSVGLDPNAPPPPFADSLRDRGILRWHAP